jgi:aryl-alcohol dehydrogenase-like predicted oxidoreductase
MVNKLILGTVQFGLEYGINNINGKPDKETVFEILSYAYNNGIKYLDTAELYGDAHSLIGEFHKSNPTQKFNIITKFPHEFEDSVEKKINTYLIQLNIDQVHAILFHSFDSYLKHKDQLKDIVQLKDKGVKYIGVSVYTNEQMDEVIDDLNIEIIQIPFNLFDNLNQRGELLKKAKEKNKIIHTRSAFLQGLFFMEKNNPNIIRTKLEKELDIISEISLKASISIGSIALNYCLLQNNIDGVLIGVDSLLQLKENIAFSETKISDQYIKEIEKINIQNVDILNPSLWKSLV